MNREVFLSILAMEFPVGHTGDMLLRVPDRWITP